jgi:polyphosphate kinase
VPLLERLKFMAISATIWTSFFKVQWPRCSINEAPERKTRAKLGESPKRQQVLAE